MKKFVFSIILAMILSCLAYAYASDNIPNDFLAVEPDDDISNEMQSAETLPTVSIFSDDGELVNERTVTDQKVMQISEDTVILGITPMYQIDYTRTLFTYRGIEKSVASSGCGAVCISMVIDFYRYDIEQTPETIFLWLFNHKLYRGNGLSMPAMCETLAEFGIQFRKRELGKISTRKALEAGYPIIAFMGDGYFTDSGHYILIYGIDDHNMVSVIDPNSQEKSSVKYRLASILQQANGSAPFYVCTGAKQGAM